MLTESSAGGVHLYISDLSSFFPRSDLADRDKPKELESIFEVFYSNKPNCTVACIYQHPEKTYL